MRSGRKETEAKGKESYSENDARDPFASAAVACPEGWLTQRQINRVAQVLGRASEAGHICITSGVSGMATGNQSQVSSSPDVFDREPRGKRPRCFRLYRRMAKTANLGQTQQAYMIQIALTRVIYTSSPSSRVEWRTRRIGRKQ